ncbi:unnamed protein product, partial [Prorocentrum cordatum]
MEGRAARARALRPGVWLPAELRGPREGLLHARGAARAGRGAPAAQRAQAGAPWPGQGRLADELPQRASDMLQSALRAMEPAWRCEVHLAPEQLSGPARGAAMLAATEVWAVEVAELLESCPSWDTAQARARELVSADLHAGAGLVPAGAGSAERRKIMRILGAHAGQESGAADFTPAAEAARRRAVDSKLDALRRGDVDGGRRAAVLPLRPRASDLAAALTAGAGAEGGPGPGWPLPPRSGGAPAPGGGGPEAAALPALG